LKGKNKRAGQRNGVQSKKETPRMEEGEKKTRKKRKIPKMGDHHPFRREEHDRGKKKRSLLPKRGYMAKYLWRAGGGGDTTGPMGKNVKKWGTGKQRGVPCLNKSGSIASTKSRRPTGLRAVREGELRHDPIKRKQRGKGKKNAAQQGKMNQIQKTSQGAGVGQMRTMLDWVFV